MEGTIEFIRGILRKEGITGMDSINHCIVFIMCRLLNNKLCDKVKIDRKFSFKNITKDDDGNELENQELYDKFYCKQIGSKSFIGELILKLSFKNIKFKMEGIQNLRLILSKLKDLDIKNLSNNYDLIGTIYELHLKSGTSNSMRDLGQYYTHRLIIKYMIKLCDPTMINGIIEKILDPTMGTGGFLTMAIKYLNDKYENIDWSKNKDNIIGFDIDDNVKNMALLNIFLEIGEFCNDTVIKQDTLHNDLKFQNGTILEKADVILANEPMGLKNIIHAQCCDRIKDLKIRGTKAEPLFLQLFMEALADNGRCAVIIPDGVLFNDSNLHIETREYLVKNFNLKKVISLNGDFFLNTGVKTSILFFTKDGTKTKEVDFCEIKLKNNKIEETSIIKVNYKTIKENNYTLFVNKYNIEEIEKIEGVDYKKLGDICEFLQKGKRKSKEGLKEGKYPLYYCSILGNLWLDDYDFNEEGIMINTTNGSGKCEIYYCEKEYSVGESVIRFNSNNKKILTKYIYYQLKLNKNKIEYLFKGSNQKQLSRDDLKQFEIPIPSLKIQEKIIEKLDLLSNNVITLKTNISEFKIIMKYYIENKTKNEKKINLNDKLEFIKTGKNKPSDNKTGSKYPYYGTSGITGYTDEFLFDGNFLLTPRNGTIGLIFNINGKFYPSDHVFVLKFKEKVNIKYMYYYIMNCVNLNAKKHGSTIPNITKNDIENNIINYPSKEKQQEIVDYCDNLTTMIIKMETQIKDNNDMIKEIMNNYLNDNTIKS